MLYFSQSSVTSQGGAKNIDLNDQEQLKKITVQARSPRYSGPISHWVETTRPQACVHGALKASSIEKTRLGSGFDQCSRWDHVCPMFIQLPPTNTKCMTSRELIHSADKSKVSQPAILGILIVYFLGIIASMQIHRKI